MTNNREKRTYCSSVHLYLALQRKSKQGRKNCIRTIIRDEELDLRILEAKLKVIGGEWRIHRTVNARDIEKARKWLIKHLIDNPENASFVDSAWRTALLQKECVASEKRFMLDIDTKDLADLKKIEEVILLTTKKECTILEKHETPKGWHYITVPFDTREVCKLKNVSLLRDGYYYIKTVNEYPRLKLSS